MTDDKVRSAKRNDPSDKSLTLRRVMVDAFIMEGYDDYGNWAEDPNGTHYLVPVEAWERVKKIVNQQAERYDLWFMPLHITEDVLQRALREVHTAVEEVEE